MKRFHVKIKTNLFVTRYDKIVDAENELDARQQALRSFTRWVRNKITEDTQASVNDFIAVEI